MTDNVQILNEIEKAAFLCEKEYSHEQIIDVMKTENDFEKQICILKLKTLKSQEEADLLVFQLTEHHGLIREASASKINEFILEKKLNSLFLNQYASEAFIKAVNDINPNICRLICAVLKPLFDTNEEEKRLFLNSLYRRFEKIFEELEHLKRSRLYTKKLFNLYWSLEALAMLEPEADEKLESVISVASSLRDYTIREKAAMVLSSLNVSSENLEKVKAKLKDDENFYVKRYAEAFN